MVDVEDGAVAERVHTHGGCDEGHVVDHRREDADDEVDEEEAGGFGAEGAVEAGGEGSEDTGDLETAHGHEDAEEEEDGGSVDVLESGDCGGQLVAGFLILAADDFGGHPKDGEAEEHAEVGGQMGDGLEDGDEDEGADTHEEDELAQTHGYFDTAVALGGTLDVAFEHGADDEDGDDHADQGGDDGFDDDVDGGHLSANPEHDGGDVADGAPGTASVGGEDDHTGIEPPLFLVGDEFAEEGNHDDGGGHVVEQCGEEEGEDGDDPEEFLLVGGGDLVGDDAEALVVFNQGDDGHGAEEEEDNLCGLAEVLDEVVADESVPSVFGDEGEVAGGGCAAHEGLLAEDEEGPQEGTEGQRCGGFVDFKRMLHCDEEVSDNEYGNKCYYHDCVFLD